MEEKKTFLDYIGQVFFMYGITMAIMMVFIKIFGGMEQGASTMFQLEDRGIALETMLQFLLLSVIMVVFRVIFFTAEVIKNMPFKLRLAGMLFAIVLTIVVFVMAFGWFPANQWLPWVLFALCFLICFAISFLISLWKTKQENRLLEENLQKLKEQWREEGNE